MKNPFWFIMLFKTDWLRSAFPSIALFVDGDDGMSSNGDEKPSKKKVTGEQTDYETLYAELSQKITSGEYVGKKAYAQQQQNYQKLHDAHEAVTSELEASKAEVTKMQAQLQALTAQVDEAGNVSKTKESELVTTQSELARLKLITKDFPHLLGFEVEGLLPQSPIEQLPDALTKFSEKLGKIKADETIEDLSGSSTKPKQKSNTDRTKEVVQREMNAAFVAGKYPEYEALRTEFFKIQGVDTPDTRKIVPQ